MRALALLPLLALASCSDRVMSVDTWRYDKDLVVKVTSISSGGALGNMIYRVSYRYRGEEEVFFDGESGSHFAIQRAGRSIRIRLCDGTINKASPIWLDEPRDELIHLRLQMDCGDVM